MQKEIWKDVVGYENYYKVSNLGNVKSLDRISSYKYKGNDNYIRSRFWSGHICIQRKTREHGSNSLLRGIKTKINN